MNENSRDILIIDEQGDRSDNNYNPHTDNNIQQSVTFEEKQQRDQDKEKDSEKLKSKKYDYFNKYTQHQIDEQRYKRVNKAIQERKGRWQRIQKIQRENRHLESSKGSISLSKDISLPKRKQDLRSKSKSSSKSRSHKKLKNSSAHRLFLQAYQNNIPQVSAPYTLSPKQTRPRSTFIPHIKQQKSLQKILTKIPSPSNILSQQILHQNQIFKSQVSQYRTMVAKLQIDLATCREELLMNQKSFTNQKLCYESIIKQLKDQIILLRGFRQRYEILNEEMIKINTSKMLEEISEGKENRGLIGNYEEDSFVNSRELNKGKIKKIQKNNEKNMYNNYSLEKTIFQTIQLMLQGHEHKKSSIRLSGYSEQVLEKLEKLINKNKKHENFIYNIKQMQRKIERNSDQIDFDLSKTLGEPTVRQLWKWLKVLGSSYSFLLEIKPLLGKKLGLAESEYRSKETKQILQQVLIQF